MALANNGRPVTVTAELLDDHVNVVVAGEVDSNTAGKFEQDLRALITKGHIKMALNLENTRLITSAGLRVLLVIAKELYGLQGGLVLYGCQPNVTEVFQLTGFETILHLVDSYEEALTVLGSSLASVQGGVDGRDARVFH